MRWWDGEEGEWSCARVREVWREGSGFSVDREGTNGFGITSHFFLYPDACRACCSRESSQQSEEVV